MNISIKILILKIDNATWRLPYTLYNAVIFFRLLGFAWVLHVVLWLEQIHYAVSLPVPTTIGPVEGINVTYNGEIVIQYLGIPYATPPLGNLRFKRPEPHQRWNDTFSASEFGPSCMQYLLQNDEWLLRNKTVSEDCLQLNIFVPLLQNELPKKAVMVWIHGGGFTAGQATLFDASYIALEGNVIVVTINYRLGVFGFLYTGDENAPGNYGLWDQRLAIQWVKDNIDNFGGDSGNICIFGGSAGGFSVGVQSMSPLNQGLFQRAIFESGTISWLKDFEVRTADVAETIGQRVNCSATDSSGKHDTRALVECLRRAPSSSLLAAQGPASGFPPDELVFHKKMGPVIDGELVTGNPMTLLTNKSSSAYKMFKSVDVLAGTNNAEGGLLYFFLQSFQEKYNFNISKEIPVRVLCDLVAPSVARVYYDDDAKVSSAICAQYKVNTSSLQQTRNIVNVFADIVFIVPTVITLQAHAISENGGKTFHYLFSHQPTFTWIQTRPAWLLGANHAGELPFVFGLDAMYPPKAGKPTDEMNLSKHIMKFWTNFAKYGYVHAYVFSGKLF